MIDEPGLYDCPDAAYQADPCEQISLRSSIAWRLADPRSTPAHAAWECPRLNPHYQREEKRCFDLGSAAHAALFGRGKRIVAIDGYDYSRNERGPGAPSASDKRAARDAAYDAGTVPLLIPEMEQVKAMREAALRQIATMVEVGTIAVNPFSPDLSEKVMVWHDRRTGVLCRAALDGLCLENDTLSEYKTEGQSAAPDAFQWKARKFGYFFRVAFYRRGLEALGLSHSPSINLFVQETFPPYLLALHRVDDELIAAEDQRVHKALTIWRRCLETNNWPGYSPDGYDATLTEREQQRVVEQAPHSEHLQSEDIAADLKPTPLFAGRKR